MPATSTANLQLFHREDVCTCVRVSSVETQDRGAYMYAGWGISRCEYVIQVWHHANVCLWEDRPRTSE
jgi:hypothetical protein